MTLRETRKTIASVEDICLKEGVRLTAKKKEIFEVLLSGKKALSAYEIAHELKKKNKISTPVMSIYRALDFFQERGVVHKIISLNRYTACSHISCDHKHEMPRLAICTDCYHVDELSCYEPIKKALTDSINNIDFDLRTEHVELLGLCTFCKAK